MPEKTVNARFWRLIIKSGFQKIIGGWNHLLLNTVDIVHIIN